MHFYRTTDALHGTCDLCQSPRLDHEHRRAADGSVLEVPAEANRRQVGGSHYRTESGRQHWDLVNEFGLDYFQGQITKYVMRWRDKNGVQDLEKARHFLDKYIEINSPPTSDAAEPGPGYTNQDGPSFRFSRE